MKDDKLMGHDPLSDADTILRETYYGRARADGAPGLAPRRTPAKVERPTHYKVICISMYTQDIEELEAKVTELKKRGWTKANKSQLIRMALANLDLDTISTPRQ